MTFYTILFEKCREGVQKETLEQPTFFTDLNLDQVINNITAGRQEYNLKPFFYTPLHDRETIKYRYAIMQDLENETLFESIKAFGQSMNLMRRYLALVEKIDDKNHKEGWFLEAVNVYCEAVIRLFHDLTSCDVNSRGFVAFREYVTNYVDSHRFKSLMTDTNKLKAELSTIKYCVDIRENRVKVRKYGNEADYNVEINKTFEKFKQGAVKDYLSGFNKSYVFNHVEVKILNLVAKLYPSIFTRLDQFTKQYSHFQDETIRVFDREVQFFIAYLEHIKKIKRAGLKFCYPEITKTSKDVYAYETYDIALANKLVKENTPVVCNDFHLEDRERIFIVTGPNQGGKTTFARTFGQLHYLSSIGCPVPGREAQLFLFDRLFTHFEKEEDIKDLRGKLQDDLIRIYSVLNQATPRSIIIMNEIFASTTLNDSVLLSKKIMERVVQLDLLCVWVTFIDELASFNEKTVSMVSTVLPENPAVRTYKLVRKPSDGRAYALSIAKKHRLTYEYIKERINS